MVITDISISLPTGNFDPDKLLAYVNIVLDDQLRVRGLRIVRLNDGQRAISMPSRKVPSTCQNCRQKLVWRDKNCPACQQPCLKRQFFVDVAHPINAEFRAYLTSTILAEYDKHFS